MQDKTTDAELKPCPFCGGEAHWPEPEVNICYVGCKECASCASNETIWNTRAMLAASPSVGSVAKTDEGAVERVALAIHSAHPDPATGISGFERIRPIRTKQARAAIAALASNNVVGSVEPNDKDERVALIHAAKLLQANAIGCAQNHHGHDFAEHGMPGWLADTQRAIDNAHAALANSDEDVG